MAASVANDTLWRAGRAGSVDDIDRVCGSNGDTVGSDISGAAALDDALPVALSIVAADGVPADLWALPDDDAGGFVGGEANGLLDEGLVGGGCLSALDAA